MPTISEISPTTTTISIRVTTEAGDLEVLILPPDYVGIVPVSARRAILAIADDVGLVAMIAGIVIDVRMAPRIVSDLLLHIRPLPVLDGLRFVTERLQALLGGWEHAGV